MQVAKIISSIILISVIGYALNEFVNKRLDLLSFYAVYFINFTAMAIVSAIDE
jgi:hypothetical protein